jgi:hypothetical protein
VVRLKPLELGESRANKLKYGQSLMSFETGRKELLGVTEFEPRALRVELT